MTAEAVAAIGFKSSQVALAAFCNRGLTALSTDSVPSASMSAARSCSCLPETLQGSKTVFNRARRHATVSHKIIALARCTGNGRC
jgi:hypothetical protein